jgi:PPM family protein phosphatase
MLCPQCHVYVKDQDSFCESCGTPLGTPDIPDSLSNGTPFHSCVRFTNGFCNDCGVSIDMVPKTIMDKMAAASTHKGMMRQKNQDAIGVKTWENGWTAMIVADGVSCSSSPERAAEKAVSETIWWLNKRFAATALALSTEELEDIIKHVQKKVLSIPFESNLIGPQTTYAFALIKERFAYYGWIGDARVYVMSENRLNLWSRDDSVLQEMLDNNIPYDVAISSKNAHAILQCVGMRNKEIVPHVGFASIGSNEHIVLCSDGFWNYFKSDSDMAAVAIPILKQFGPVSLSKHLVDYANKMGGHDNISVAVSF